ncbi:AfsR/SARP family transcriptional regulator [Amycolatopsis anabasis]|uniref:AfsR/SARP family transcriptional regulator n=1 Tax=Amycolatopsis anabasis TaxID=1840409 RepID=UPI00131E5C99|nr:tetratricopeptide repeat protein [Amycolatopsis anabasis]
MTSSDIRFSVLGPLTAWRTGRKIELGWARQQAVLAVLVLELNRPVPVHKIVDGVWGDRGPRDARNAVQTYVSRLRRVLRADAAPAEPPLVFTKAGYLLRGDPADLDLVAFERHLDAARERYRTGDLPGAADQVDAALALWRGEPFGGLDGPLLEAERQRLQERHLGALELRATINLDRGRTAESIAELTRLVTGHPLQERLRALLMLALCRCGRQAAALDVFQDGRRRLADELGIDPGEELRRLHERILRGDPALATPAPPGRNTLPGDVQDFTGREAELRRLLAAAGTGPATAAVVEAIDGSAGVGKTALAVHVAHRLIERYPDAQLFINLHGHTAGHRPTEPLAALDTLLRALGVPGERIPGELAARAGLWRAELADRAALVVLDNAADADQVRPLLPGTARCLTLITSRRRMVDLDAHTLSLDVLPRTDAVELFTRIVDDDRLAVDPDSVDEAVRLCGRLPLALRIAAARLRTRPAWSLRYLTDRLRRGQRRLAELSAGDRSVAAAFSLSYRQLTGEQQRLFRLLGLHPGPDLDAHAAAALGDDDLDATERLLEALVDVHVLQQPMPGRYRFHDLLRHYARATVQDHEPEAERQAAITRLLDYYLRTTAKAVHTLAPHERDRRGELPAPGRELCDYDQALAWLDTERPNLLAAAGQAHADRLSRLLGPYLHLRNHLADALTLDTHALTAARDTGDRIDEGRALRRLGHDYYRLDRYERALACHQQAMVLFRAAGEHGHEGDALRDLGVMHGLFGRYREAISANRQALAIARDIGDRAGESDALAHLGVACERLGQYHEALAHHHQALAIAREIGHRAGECFARCELGVVHNRLGDYPAALEQHRRALDLARQIGHRAHEGYARCRLGEVHRHLGHYRNALSHHREALAIAREIGHRAGEGYALCGLGLVCERLGRYQDALAHHREALAIAREVGNRADESYALCGLGLVCERLGRYEDALAHHRQALALAREIGHRAREVDALRGLGMVRERLGQHGDARVLHDQARALAREIGYHTGKGAALNDA